MHIIESLALITDTDNIIINDIETFFAAKNNKKINVVLPKTLEYITINTNFNKLLESVTVDADFNKLLF